MSPTGVNDSGEYARFPRPRGDEPTYGERTAYEQMFSPPTRG